MTDAVQAELLHLILEGLGLIIVSGVGFMLQRMVKANSMDQARAFKDAGVWRQEVNTRLAVLEERTGHMASRVERIPTGTQGGYRRTTKGSD